ncbi:MAG: hypothetical protein U0441_21770, partial [Polyangiaceae bacterium]
SKVPGEGATTPLLMTTDRSFGMVDFFAWAKNPTPPQAKPEDHKGPLTVAWAVEMPKPANAQRGGRAVVVGTWGVLVSSNWQAEELRGTAAFVESAISWLVARPSLVAVPKKPSIAAGLRVSEDDLTRLGLYTVLCMPLASALFGVAVFLRRKSSEKRGKKGDPAPREERAKTKGAGGARDDDERREVKGEEPPPAKREKAPAKKKTKPAASKKEDEGDA